MSNQLEHLGLYTDGVVHKAKYAGHEVDKMVFATSEHALQLALLFDDIMKSLTAVEDD